jgi:hypothetical protein
MEEQAIALPDLPGATTYGGARWAGAAFYTNEQMRDYARAAVLQERERCARVCEEEDLLTVVYPEAVYVHQGQLAAAIRKGN